MSTSFYPAQLPPYTLAGSGVVQGATSMTLTSMLDFLGNQVAMSVFGQIGYLTLELTNALQEEQISFTGITQNSNGTATLTGIQSVAFTQPYASTSGFNLSHPGGAQVIASNSAAFYQHFVSKDETGTVNDVITFATGATPLITDLPTTPQMAVNKSYADSLAIAGAPNASTSVQGLVQLPTQAQVYAKTATGSTGAALGVTPNLLASTINYDYVIDTGTANAYAIAPTPAITSYVTGQIFSFKAIHTNTGVSTLNVNGLGTKNIFKNGQFALVGGEIKNGGIYQVEYDGTQFQLVSPISKSQISQNGAEIYATSTTGNTAYVAAITPAPTAYIAGLIVNLKPDTGGGHATLNLNSLGVKNIYRWAGGSLGPVVTGDIIANQTINLEYDGTEFVMQSTRGSPGFGAWASAGASSGQAYQVSTDGFLVFYGGATVQTATVIVYSDSSSSPSTVRASWQAYDTNSDTVIASFCVPIRNGDYYKIVLSSFTITNAYFLPLLN